MVENNISSNLEDGTERPEGACRQAWPNGATFDKAVQRFLGGSLRVAGIRALRPFGGSGRAELRMGALATYFANTSSPLTTLLQQAGLRAYLERPLSQVRFDQASHQPIFSKYEQRIYNLAVSRDTPVPYRHARLSRITPKGDTVAMPYGDEMIGDYFTSRRSAQAAREVMIRRLEAEASGQTGLLPVHTSNPASATVFDGLRHAAADAAGRDRRLHCYVLSGQHGHYGVSVDALHTGTMLAVMKGSASLPPKRLIFFDSMDTARGMPRFEASFRSGIDAVFPVPAGETPVSSMAENGSVPLFRGLHPMPRLRDVDCALYAFAMARALIQIACTQPNLVLHADIARIKTEMTARMPDFFSGPDQLRPVDQRRAAGIALRWDLGRGYLQSLAAAPLAPAGRELKL